MHLSTLQTAPGATIEDRIEDLLERMTLEEKIRLCHAGSKFAVSAIPRLGIPEFWMSDGPHGVRHEICRDSWDPVETDEDRSTYLPMGTALAATWNPGLAREFGEVLGAEARHRGKDMILGPGINIVRTPICGRNFEYYGEDPFHIAKVVVPAVRGIQSQQVAVDNLRGDRSGRFCNVWLVKQIATSASHEIQIPLFSQRLSTPKSVGAVTFIILKATVRYERA